MPTHHLISDYLSVTIDSAGAEMHSIKTSQGQELLWQADESVWGRHAPHLFPIVGRLNDDTVKHNGGSYTMTQHGFARDMEFTIESSSDNHCTLLLTENDESKQRYPFKFAFRVHYELDKNTLRIGYDVTNSGEETLPFSVGAHPAFNWPLSDDADRSQHVIEFEHEEPADIRQLDNGLLKPQGIPSPLDGKTLHLKDELFELDALIFDQHKSREVVYKADNAPTITVSFADFPHLGIWTKPGAGFVCIEPWQGHSSGTDFRGEFSDKPGSIKLQAGEQRQWWFSVKVSA